MIFDIILRLVTINMSNNNIHNNNQNNNNNNKNNKKSKKVPITTIFNDRQLMEDIDEIGVHKDGAKERDSTGETGMIYGKVSTHKLKKFIVKSIVQPTYVEDIRDVLVGRYRWRKVGMVLFIISLVLSSIATALTFVTAFESQSWLGLFAGGIGVIGAIFLHCSSMAKGESKRLTHQANKILKQLEIDGIPDIEEDKDQKELNNFGDQQKKRNDNVNVQLDQVIIGQSFEDDNNKDNDKKEKD